MVTLPGGVNLNFNVQSIVSGVGLLIIGIVVISLVFFVWWYYSDKKKWTKRVTRFELVNSVWTPTYRDVAKLVKLGTGGFEVLYWKKAKIYRIAFGTRVGRNDYYFFTAPDGYDYNGYLGGPITKDGVVPVVTTNPSMRSQYTALEKQIDSLHGQKQSWLDKYGSWIFSLGFILVIGVFAYLFFREWSGVVGQMPQLVKTMTDLVDRVNELLISANNRAITTGGLVSA